MSTRLPNCTINLNNVGKYLDIDSDIIGIKYNYADLSVMKGSYATTIYKKAKIKDSSKINKELFYNQITIIVNNNSNHVNVKLFGNGSCHLTGCKSVNEGAAVTKLLYQKLANLKAKTDRIILAKDANGLLLDKDNLIYSYTAHQVIGYAKQDGSYVIHKKEYEIDKKTGMLISKKFETQRTKPLVNFDGTQIGHTKIELLKNKNKFYKKNVNIFYDTDNGLIYYNNELIIGKIVHEVDYSMVSDIEQHSDVIEIVYTCNPFIDTTYALDTNDQKFSTMIDSNVNCINVYFKLNYKLNRQRLYEKLIELDYICKYKPDSYSGIKLIYKLPVDDKYSLNGHCRCTVRCTCTNVTFLIFQSGNVIATGFKSIEQINQVTQNFIETCNLHKDIIRKKDIPESTEGQLNRALSARTSNNLC